MLICSLSILLSGCEGWFGKKTKLDFIPVPVYTNKPVEFVPVQPVISNLVFPVDIIAGYDQLIYVADAGAEEIVCFDESGNRLSSFKVPGITAIAQSRNLDLYAVGTLDTIIDAKPYTLSAIYHISEKSNNLLSLRYARVVNKIIHPFYFRTAFSAPDALVKLQGVTILGDNSFYVTRTGPSTSITQLGGPDDAVLSFDENDKFVTPIQVQTQSGLLADYFKKPKAICGLAQPPQSTFVSQSGDFLYTSLAQDNAIKVQYITKTSTDNGVSYTLRDFGSGDTSKASNYIYQPYHFDYPQDVSVAGDGTGYIFVVDSKRDSVYQFSTQGYEGVNPPPGFIGTKFIKTSFGGKGVGLSQFNQPMGVVYYNKVLFVADAGNGRILRFKLTTDIK
jgi:hypothetical protein